MATTSKQNIRQAMRDFVEYPSLNNLMRIRTWADGIKSLPCQAAGRPILDRSRLILAGLCYYCPLGRVVWEDGNMEYYCPISPEASPTETEYVWREYSGMLIIAMIQFIEGFKGEDDE